MGPKFDPAELAREEDGYIDQFQAGTDKPCAWVHYSCLVKFIMRHAPGTAPAIKL